MIKVSRGCLGEAELAGIREVLASGYFGLGAQVLQFEAELQRFLGAAHVIAVNTGTSALHLALDALGIGPGDEVLVPSLTFAACFQAIRATGATPVACEIAPDTLQLDLTDAERRITARTRAIMPVDYAGAPSDMDAVLELAGQHRLRVVEDAAHAFGATSRGRRVGSFGDLVCFSFDSIKNISCGEGGAIICSDAELAEQMRRKRMLGTDRPSHTGALSKAHRWQFQVVTSGYRYHLGNINAAVGLAQLKKLDGFLARRRAICRRYDEAFREFRGLRPLRIDYREAAPHIYVVRVKDGRRDALMEALAQAGIETSVHYVPNHLQPYFRIEGLKLPETERAFAEMLTLPLHCGLSDEEVETVVEQVHEFFSSLGG